MEVSGLRPICYQRCVFLTLLLFLFLFFAFCFPFLNGMFKTLVGHYALFLSLFLLVLLLLFCFCCSVLFCSVLVFDFVLFCCF
jgi:hypothetical protein